MKRSSREVPGAASPEPPVEASAANTSTSPRATPDSFPYMAAVSKWRYPASRAVATRLAVSFGGSLYSPKPNWSISTPLFRLSRGEVVMDTTLPIPCRGAWDRQVEFQSGPGNLAPAQPQQRQKGWPA